MVLEAILDINFWNTVIDKFMEATKDLFTIYRHNIDKYNNQQDRYKIFGIDAEHILIDIIKAQLIKLGVSDWLGVLLESDLEDSNSYTNQIRGDIIFYNKITGEYLLYIDLKCPGSSPWGRPTVGSLKAFGDADNKFYLLIRNHELETSCGRNYRIYSAKEMLAHFKILYKNNLPANELLISDKDLDNLYGERDIYKKPFILKYENTVATVIEKGTIANIEDILDVPVPSSLNTYSTKLTLVESSCEEKVKAVSDMTLGTADFWIKYHTINMNNNFRTYSYYGSLFDFTITKESTGAYLLDGFKQKLENNTIEFKFSHINNDRSILLNIDRNSQILKDIGYLFKCGENYTISLSASK